MIPERETARRPDGPINWRGGFLRAWTVIAVSWIAVTTHANWSSLTGESMRPVHAVSSSSMAAAAPLKPFDLNALLSAGIAGKLPPPSPVPLERDWGPNIEAAWNIFAPPLGLLLAGVAIGWVIRGFRPSRNG